MGSSSRFWCGSCRFVWILFLACDTDTDVNEMMMPGLFVTRLAEMDRKAEALRDVNSLKSRFHSKIKQVFVLFFTVENLYLVV